MAYVFTDEEYAALSAELDEAKRRREEMRRVGQYRGRFYLDWTRDLDAMRKAKQDDEAIEMILELLPIAAKATAISGNGGPGGLVERLALLYQRNGRLAEEIALLESWRHLESDRLEKRLARVRRLAS